MPVVQLSPRQIPLSRITGSGLVVSGSPANYWWLNVDQNYAYNWENVHRWGTGKDSILIDGISKNIRTYDFVSGLQGFKIDSHRLEASNAKIRGSIETNVLEYKELSATNGTLLIAKSAATAKNNITLSSGSFSFDLNTPTYGNVQLFNVDDIVWIKSPLLSTYGQITSASNIGSYYSYGCEYLDGATSGSYYAGQAIISFGSDFAQQSFIYESADDSVSPGVIALRQVRPTLWSSGHNYLLAENGDRLMCEDNSLMTLDGPQSSEINFDELLRIGNLSGLYNESGIGFYCGDQSSYLKFTKDTGLKIVADGSSITNINGASIQTGTISANAIATHTITSDKMRISELSSISGSLGSLYITGSLISGTYPSRIEITPSLISGISSGSQKEFYLQANDGIAYFGNGFNWLSASGLYIKSTGGAFVPQSQIHFYRSDNSDDMYTIGHYNTSTDNGPLWITHSSTYPYISLDKGTTNRSFAIMADATHGLSTVTDGTHGTLWGDWCISGKAGFNGASEQGKFSVGGAATDITSVISLANNLRQMAINLGLAQ